MTKSPKSPASPFSGLSLDLLTADEVREAVIRFVLQRKGVADVTVELGRIDADVSYRQVRLPDGTLTTFAAVGIVPKRADAAKATDTPKPEPTDG